jgi:RNA polymerase sigma factor (sigma-70 family)
VVRSDDESTRPSLLERVRNRQNHPAWVEFLAYYDPMLRRWSRHLGFGDEASDELLQQTWERVWPLLLTFEYDPSRRFRGWLWRIFYSRAMNLRAEPYAGPTISLECLPIEDRRLASREVDPGMFDSEGPEVGREESLALLREAEEAQAAVRAGVEPETWQAFWLTRIEGRSIREVADSLGKAYAAVYYGSQRVEQKLRREGERRLSKLLRSDR